MVAAYPATLITDLTSEAGLHADLHNQLLGATYNVKAYGAKGDGTTNDTAAFTSAISVATEIFLPGSDNPYIFSPTTLTRNNLRYRGMHGQTTVKLTSQLGGANAALLTIGGSNLLFEDIIFDGNSGTISSGDYWSGLIRLLAGAYQITFRRCLFQNIARSAIYGLGSAGSQIAGIIVDDCRFTGIGTAGAGSGGACVMLEQNIHDCEIRDSRAYGRLSSNFLKLKGDLTTSQGISVKGNILDYTTCTTFDATNSALGIEFWNGTYNSRCLGNQVYGPNTVPVTGEFWGISFGDGRGSECIGNEVIGGTNNQAMRYGLEVGECPSIGVTGNHIANAICGSNFTNNNPLPSHSIILQGNTYENCYDNGIVSDSAPSAFKIIGDTLIDCGQAYLFFNSINVGGGDGTVKDGIIALCTFQIKNQTRAVVSAGGDGVRNFGIVILGTAVTNVARVDIGSNNFGPYPGGSSTLGLTPLEVNNPRGVKLHDGSMDGARPSDGAAQADHAILAFCGDFHAHDVTAVNFTTDFATLVPGTPGQPLCTFSFNKISSLPARISANANVTFTEMYWSTADGRLHVRNAAGTDAAVGP